MYRIHRSLEMFRNLYFFVNLLFIELHYCGRFFRLYCMYVYISRILELVDCFCVQLSQ